MGVVKETSRNISTLSSHWSNNAKIVVETYSQHLGENLHLIHSSKYFTPTQSSVSHSILLLFAFPEEDVHLAGSLTQSLVQESGVSSVVHTGLRTDKNWVNICVSIHSLRNGCRESKGPK